VLVVDEATSCPLAFAYATYPLVSAPTVPKLVADRFTAEIDPAQETVDEDAVALVVTVNTLVPAALFTKNIPPSTTGDAGWIVTTLFNVDVPTYTQVAPDGVPVPGVNVETVPALLYILNAVVVSCKIDDDVKFPLPFAISTAYGV
jgi:hypothetical protein